jgi:hypothetical protein
MGPCWSIIWPCGVPTAAHAVACRYRGRARRRDGMACESAEESRAEQRLLRDGVAGGQWVADGVVLPE